MLIAAVAALTVTACTKKEDPQNTDPNKENTDPDPKDDPAPASEVKLAIDGKFDEWKDVEDVEGSEAILRMKAVYTADKLYFYLEGDASLMVTDKLAYANKLYLYFDCEGDGGEHIGYWGGEAGTNYDLSLDFWVMQSGKVSMMVWDTPGWATKGKIEDGVVKAEFCFSREVNEIFSAKKIMFGAAMFDSTCDYDEEGGEEWGGGACIGQAPLAESDLVLIKKSNL